MASVNQRDSIVKSYVYPDKNIPVKVKRGYLTPPPNADHLSTGTYEYTVYPDRIEHKALAALPNVEGGWGIDGKRQKNFYRVWLYDGKNYAKLGDMVRTLDGVYTYTMKSLPKELAQYKMTLISLEARKSSTKPNKIILMGKLDDKVSYNVN